MKIAPPEPGVNLYEDGFDEQDLLQRKRLGDALSDLLNRIDDPFVIAVDGKWGTGKTYFLKRWVGAHARREDGKAAAVVYFDAFAHDGLGDPLPALVSALEERISQTRADDSAAEREKSIREMKEAAFRLAKPLARAALVAAGAGTVLSAADEIANAKSEEAADCFDGFWEAEKGRRLAMEQFRNAVESLAALADGVDTGSTVVVVVDELDRCRPDYALEVLEVIKHFFTVPRLHFVLGVNLTALEDMVCARYGSGIDAHAYLAKFIQVTLNLPDEIHDTNQQKQAVLLYLDHLVGDMGIPQHIAEPLREQVKIVSRSNPVSLRDVEGIVSSLSLASGEIMASSASRQVPAGQIMVMIDLVVSRIVRRDLYQKFLEATVTPSDLELYLGVTGNVLREQLDGQSNPDYDHAIAVRYHAWIYLSRNGQTNDDDPDILKDIPRIFSGRTFLMEKWRSLPKAINRQWLDRFSFYHVT